MSTSGLPFIDAHHHLWDDAAPHGLLASVHVQGEIDRALSLEETRWLQALADERGFPHAIIAYAPLQDPHVGDTLAEHARYANVRGIRQILNPDQCERPDYLTHPEWLAGYGQLARFGMSFDLQALPAQLADAAAVAAAHPETQMIVNHTGMPREQTPAGLDLWRRGMRTLARQPNASVEISGFGMFDPRWTTDSIRPLGLDTIAIFGVDRCMFGSNFPVDRVWSTYPRLMQAFQDITAELSEADRRKLFHDNAARVYRVQAPGSAGPL